MEALRSILVLMEPALEQQAAFEAALPMARSFDARLHLLMTDYRDLHVSFYEPPAPGLVQFRESVQAAHRVTLERCVERAASLGVTATFECIWGTPFHELAIERIKALKPGLVMKQSVHHGRVERTLFTGSDWHLIRDCPAPLLLVKDPARLAAPRILVCVDPQHLHDKPAALDHQLLGSASLLNERLGGEVHALHVFALPHPVAVIGDAYVAAAGMVPDDATLEAANKSLHELLAAHPAVRENAHLRVGVPALDIVSEALALDADIILMGAVSRRRLERWFIGNTAEAVLDRVPCNVWIEKPQPPA
jgi:universal stress protein E